MTATNTPPTAYPITAQSYGKDNVRLMRVIRGGDGWHEMVEQTVNVMLDGDFNPAYTHADNSQIVATDSMRNTVYALAKVAAPQVEPEVFAQQVARHMLDHYRYVSSCTVRIRQATWHRLVTAEGALHPHAFRHGGDEIRTVQVVLTRTATDPSVYMAAVRGGMDRLALLKTTGSSFNGFVRDQFTTLPEVNDRIMCTMVTAHWDYRAFQLPAAPVSTGSTDAQWRQLARQAADGRVIGPDTINFGAVYRAARERTLRIFADDNSASVQATLYRIAAEMLDVTPDVEHVHYTLPNRHVFSVDLSPFQLANTGDKGDATVFMPIDAPNGLISATVSRSPIKARL